MDNLEKEKEGGLKKNQIKQNWKWLRNQNNNENFSICKNFNLDPDPCENQLDGYYDSLKERLKERDDHHLTGQEFNTQKMLDVGARFIIKNHRNENFHDLIKDLLIDEFFDDLDKVVERYTTIPDKTKIKIFL